jgi:hypothetical protein
LVFGSGFTCAYCRDWKNRLRDALDFGGSAAESAANKLALIYFGRDFTA